METWGTLSVEIIKSKLRFEENWETAAADTETSKFNDLIEFLPKNVKFYNLLIRNRHVKF